MICNFRIAVLMLLLLLLLLSRFSCVWLFEIPMNCSPTGSSVHRILQARIIEWVAIPFSRRSSKHRDRTQVFHIAGRFFTNWEPEKPKSSVQPIPFSFCRALKLSHDAVVGQMRKNIRSSWVIHMIFLISCIAFFYLMHCICRSIDSLRREENAFMSCHSY